MQTVLAARPLHITSVDSPNAERVRKAQRTVDTAINKRYETELCIVCDCTIAKSGAVRSICSANQQARKCGQ